MQAFGRIGAGLLLGVLAALAADPEPPASDARVGFPVDYLAKFQVIRVANKTQKTQLGTIYANAAAASVKEPGQLPYPAGSIIVMEWTEPLRAADGTLLTDADGLWRKGPVVRVDVMRREAGYGEIYGDKRSGEWEFASYGPDGRCVQPSATAASCAECHAKAGPTRDYVFRGRFPPAEKN